MYSVVPCACCIVTEQHMWKCPIYEWRPARQRLHKWLDAHVGPRSIKMTIVSRRPTAGAGGRPHQLDPCAAPSPLRRQAQVSKMTGTQGHCAQP